MLIDSSTHLTVEKVAEILQYNTTLELSSKGVELVQKCRDFLDSYLPKAERPVYGINTGFGSLCDTVINDNEIETLQRNLLLSHACGMGEEVPSEIVKIMLLLKAKGLSYGHSGVQVQTVERLLTFFNLNIIPVVYQQGSLGASGDLAPLAHMCLPLIGEGEVYYKGKKMRSAEALKTVGLEPIVLKSKEGLALINGTQFMSAYFVWILIQTEQLVEKGFVITAMSIDAFGVKQEPFSDLIHSIRPHSGQTKVAKEIYDILADSELQKVPRPQVQDAYSFRCIPQVHGASMDAIQYAKNVVETEINSVTDNPLIFPDEQRILSGGNFHGQPLALSLDFLAIALAELGSMSERRTYKLISGQRELPAYLVKNPGLNSGLMIAQYTCASIVSQNKQLCTPSSVDTIDSSNGQEDHVSMGANAATKCYRVVENIRSIFAIELLTAAQALEFRRPKKSAPVVEALHAEVRSRVPFIEEDVYLHQHMDAVRQLLK
jgi:histidine ammonia-lyase